MSTYNQYLNRVKQEEFIEYQEVKDYLDELVKKGVIHSYDESMLKKVLGGMQNTVTAGLLATTLAGPMQAIDIDILKLENGLEAVINVKKEVKAIEEKLVKLNPRDADFGTQSEKILNDISQIEKNIQTLKEKDLISKSAYYMDVLKQFKIYINANRKKVEEDKSKN